VRRLVPALGALLVDIGGDRLAFLPESEVLPRGRRLDEGERVIVQIRREAQSGKAARVTTGVTLRGRLVELRAGRSGILGGENLPPEQRSRLFAPSLSLPGERGREGWGLRLIEPAPVEAIILETTDLLQRWRDISDRALRLAPPCRLDPPTSFAAALAGALPAAPSLILVDDPAAIPELRAVFPDSTLQHQLEAEWSIELDAVFDQVLSATVALAGSGSVHIEPTRAAVLIDVDSGTPEWGSADRTALAVNLAAANTIARQIRLRNLGGGIVVDFVGLDHRGLRERVREAFAKSLAADPAQPQIIGWTRLGHFELVRPRRGRPLAEVLLEPRSGGPLVKTAITVAHEAMRALRREARAQPGRQWRLTAAQEVAAALADDAADALAMLEERFARKIGIEADPNLAREQFHIAPL
jgi:ribonuclease G